MIGVILTGVLFVFMLYNIFMFSNIGESLYGTWRAEWPHETTYSFSGNTFTEMTTSYNHISRQQFTDTNTGTFSLGRNRIEFKYSNGRVGVRSFSRTENTITIGAYRYDRLTNMP